MDIRKTARKLEVLLKLDRKIVGVKLIHNREEFMRYEGRELVRPMGYCVAVKCASKGHSIKLTRSTGGCAGGNRALGLTECGPDFKSGVGGHRLGLYRTPEVAAGVAGEVPICAPDTYGVVVKPLEEFEEAPDVVLIISDSREAMRILQGYTYIYGLTKGLCMSGNQAVCVEATVTPLVTKELNVSMLCSGTRYHAGWKDTEVITGLPWEKAAGLAAGLAGTVNAVEMDERKKEIEAGLQALEELDFVIEYGKTYFKTWKKEK